MSAFVSAPLLLAAVLIMASMAKWKARDSLISASRLLRLPRFVYRPVRQLPPVELALGIALIVAPLPAVFVAVGVLALGLMVIYTVIVARGLTFTPPPSCGCFGAIGSPITNDTLLRNLVLTGLGVVTVAWGLRGHTVPGALLAGDLRSWGWLAALAVSALVTRWVVREREMARPTSRAADAVATATAPTASEVGDEEYVREPIPAQMLMRDGRPVTLSKLAVGRAALLIWVTCGCAGTREVVDNIDQWRTDLHQIDVHLVSTLTPEVSQQLYPHVKEWLFDIDRGVRMTMPVPDPAALLLGADGYLAGGPVGAPDTIGFLNDIRDQLSGAGAVERVSADEGTPFEQEHTDSGQPSVSEGRVVVGDVLEGPIS